MSLALFSSVLVVVEILIKNYMHNSLKGVVFPLGIADTFSA
jgi:hypothetical protein